MNKPYKVGMFPMCADILHAGHMLALEEAAEKCEWLIVALNTHPDGKNPVQGVWERSIQLAAVKWIDQIICYQGKKEMELIASIFDYDVRFVGGDYNGLDWDGKAQEEARGIPVYYLRRNHGFSSSELKRRIIESEKSCEMCD